MSQAATNLAAPNVPNTEEVASLPRRERRSASAVADWIETQYTNGQARRALHAVQWIKVTAIMSGIHWFRVNNGVLNPIRQTHRGSKKIRAHVPIMEPFYDWQMGRLNSNRIGVSTRPRTGKSQDSAYRAERAQAILDNWTNEIDIENVFDNANQKMLYYGLVAYYRYADPYNNQVWLRSIPGSELYPIPFDATAWEDCDGIMQVTQVSEGWLELQDEIQERMTGQAPRKKMASKSTDISNSLSTSAISIGYGVTGKGAAIKNVWMKPSQQRPHGEYMFLIEDELYRHWTQPVEGVPDPIPMVGRTRRIPLEPVYYKKKPHAFWGYGFLEQLIAPQMEANRQASAIIRSAQQNRNLTFVQDGAVDIKHIQDDEASAIPFQMPAFEQRLLPAFNLPGQPIGRDTLTVFQFAERNAERAAGFESRIIFGEAEGRVEGGPANSLLNQNAQTPLAPVLKRIARAFSATYPAVLDMLRTVWPQEKTVRTVGSQQIGKEILITQNEVPASEDIDFSPAPMLAGGTNAMAQILFNLRQLPADDGQGALLKEPEFRRSLRMLGFDPPGLDIIDPKEERIGARLGMLINDGQRPAIPPINQDQVGQTVQRLEDHRMASNMTRDRVLAPEFVTYGPDVKSALLEELKFHHTMASGVSPDQFDDSVETVDANQQERSLHAIENSMDTNDGQFSHFGSLLGAQP
jgi:hypothetical protein